MIWLLIPAFLFVMAIIAGISTRDANYFWGWTTAAIIVSVILLIPTGVCTYHVLDHRVNIQRIQDDIVAKRAEYEDVKADIEACIKSYPLEKGGFENLSRTFLLRLPEVKSDVLLAKKISHLAKLRNDVFQLTQNLNATKAKLRWHESRWFSMTLADPCLKK